MLVLHNQGSGSGGCQVLNRIQIRLLSLEPDRAVVKYWTRSGGCQVLNRIRRLSSLEPDPAVVKYGTESDGCRVLNRIRRLSCLEPDPAVVKYWTESGSGCQGLNRIRDSCRPVVYPFGRGKQSLFWPWYS